MHYHFSTQDLILAAVLAHLLAALAKTVFVKPGQQAQIDALDAKVGEVLDTVTTALPLLQKPPAARPSSLTDPDSTSLALNPLPSPSQNSYSAGAQGGAL